MLTLKLFVLVGLYLFVPSENWKVLYVAQPSCVPWSLDDADLLALAEMTKAKLSAEGHLSQRKGRPPAELYWFLVGSDQILCESLPLRHACFMFPRAPVPYP